MTVKLGMDDWLFFNPDATLDDVKELTVDSVYDIPQEVIEAVRKANKRKKQQPAPETNSNGPGDRRPIAVTNQDFADVVNQAWEGFKEWNDKKGAEYFQRGGPVRIASDDYGRPVIQALTRDRMRLEASNTCWFFTYEEGLELDDKGNLVYEQKQVKPPMDVIDGMLASRSYPLPVVKGITEVPMFGQNHQLRTEQGYDPATKRLYRPPAGLTIPKIPMNPSRTSVFAARDFIQTELFGDFLYAGDADRAAIFELLLLPFCLGLIEGPLPLHGSEAASQGTGKSLQISVALLPAFGNKLAVTTIGKDEDETRKKLTTYFREGQPAILFDNVRRLDSDALSAALTTTEWSDRILSKNESIKVEISTIITATGNNIPLSKDIIRRYLRCRILALSEHPELRQDFRHPNLIRWATQHRGELVAAALTCIQSWVVAGMKPGVRTLGSYEEWSAVMGGILDHLEVPGFLENVMDVSDNGDAECDTWKTLVSLWWERFHDSAVTSSDLFPIAKEIDGIPLGKSDSERSQSTAFGTGLQRQKDLIFGDLRVVRSGKSHNKTMWKLEKLSLPVSVNTTPDAQNQGNLDNLGNLSTLPVRTEERTKQPHLSTRANTYTQERALEGSPGSPGYPLVDLPADRCPVCAGELNPIDRVCDDCEAASKRKAS